MFHYDDFEPFNYDDCMNLFHRTAATAAQTPPPCTEILPEEAIRYIDAIRKAAYDQGYIDGYECGVEETENEIMNRLNF